MSLDAEQYAEYLVPADALWEVVGDPRRLPEWTGLSAPLRISAGSGPDEPLGAWEADVLARVHDGEAVRQLRVITARRGVVEVTTDTGCGRVGIGVRVVGEANRPGTSRLVVAGQLDPSRGALRARTLDLPRLRRRFDAWAAQLRSTVES